MERTPQEQVFLDKVYIKARLMEVHEKEEEKVRENSRKLAKRRNQKLIGAALASTTALFILYFNQFELGVCFLVSFGLIILGLGLEKADLRWNAGLQVRKENEKWN